MKSLNEKETSGLKPEKKEASPGRHLGELCSRQRKQQVQSLKAEAFLIRSKNNKANMAT